MPRDKLVASQKLSPPIATNVKLHETSSWHLKGIVFRFMGIGFVLTIWLAICGVITAAYLLLFRSRVATSLKKATAIFGAVIGVVIALNIVIRIPDCFPSYVYESSFGIAPTPDVLELKGYRFKFGDSGDAFLRFRANKQTIEGIVARTRLYGINEIMFKRQTDSISPPSYWKPFEGKPKLFYESNRFDDSFGSSRAILCYDESNEVAHFYWIGVD